MALRHRTDSIAKYEEALSEVMDKIALSYEDLNAIKEKVKADVKAKLEAESDKDNSRMLNSYVAKIPSGCEKGEYIVLDFGGRFFRVVYVRLNQANSANADFAVAPKTGAGTKLGNDEAVFMESKIYPLRKNQTKGSEELFKLIAKSCADFCARFRLEDDPVDIVLVNSFPCRHESINKATLIRWNKGLHPSDGIGLDVSELLQNAITEAGLPHKVVAIVNDTVACLFTGVSEEVNTKLGLIIGTGFNLSFLRTSEDTTQAVNAEMGSFGDDGELDEYLTGFDKDIVHASYMPNPGKQVIEKLVSGTYLPEIFRIMVKHFIDEGIMFNGVSSDQIDRVGGIPGSFLPQIIRAGTQGLNHVQDVLINIDLCGMYADAEACLSIAKMLTHRAAGLVAACLAGIVEVSNYSKHSINICVDGSFYKSHPLLASSIQEMTQELLDGHEVTFRTSFDGSAKGAAFLAAANVA